MLQFYTKRTRTKRFGLKQMLTAGLVVMLLAAPFNVTAASGGMPGNKEQLSLVEQFDFEHDTGGFVSGSAAVASENGVLKATGSGSGNRSAAYQYAAPVNAAEVQYTFDWKPEDVTTAANSSELLWRDANEKPLFRIVKQGGENGGIYYGAGSTGTDLSSLSQALASHSQADWLTVEVYFDFAAEQIHLRLYDKQTELLLIDSGAISLSSVDYINQIGSVMLNGNRSSGQSLQFTMYIDDFKTMASKAPAPEQLPQAVAEIVTEYAGNQAVPLNQALEDVVSILPPTVDIRLANGALRTGIPLIWSSDDYNAAAPGSYAFKGELELSALSRVINPNDIAAQVTITVEAGAAMPEKPGYVTALYTDFGDQGALVPAYWGFTTANATLSLHTEQLAGNSSSKLHFNITDQSGGRVASRNFAQAYMGEEVVLEFDWYPGKVNDKGSNPNENGGELRITNSSNQTIFTLNHTNNAPLSYYIGNGEQRAATAIVEPEAWYHTVLVFDYVHNEIRLSLSNDSLGVHEEISLSMDGLSMDTKLGGMRLGGVRTSGNNLTWDTYLDNVALYVSPLSDHAITLVDQLPYHRIYVGQATDELASIGLPDEVEVTLADGSKALAAITAWEEVDPWNASAAGVYEFRGVLDDDNDYENPFNKTALLYVYNRLEPLSQARNTEWLDRGVIALSADDGIFVSWRLLADEYNDGVAFYLYRNGTLLNDTPLLTTNYVDTQGKPGDQYTVATVRNGRAVQDGSATALETDYLAIPLQKPEGGETATGSYTYSANDASVGDLDGDGEYEIIVKWYPSNAIDSSQSGMTGPTIFDAYKLDGTLLWRMNMGLNLTSGAHYHQFIVADLDGDGRSEFLIKTADATTVYGATEGQFDESKVISVIGNAEDNGRWVNESGKVFDGPEYISVFEGLTGKEIDTIDYVFALGDVASWGDSFHNRSDRFLAGLAYLDGKKPSVVYGRGYYERTTFAAYSLVDGKLITEWTFDSAAQGRGGGLGYHSLATGDVDNDGFDEIIAGSLVLDEDGSILYMMDGNKGRERGSHGDAMHVGAFDPDREGLHFIGVHEDPAVASLEFHDGATGETIMSFYGSVDAGRGLAANITTAPGYEFWGTAPDEVEKGGGIYNVQNKVVADSHRAAGLSVNFALYWDGDLLHELLDHTSITKYNEHTQRAELLRAFEGVASNNGTKATPTLQADILGDWREEVVLPAADSSELRIYSTTIPTEYRLYTLMHDTVYRMGIAWQNVAYNQPPHLGFYLGEDIREQVLAGELTAPSVSYTNPPRTTTPEVTAPIVVPPVEDAGVDLSIRGDVDESTDRVRAAISDQQWSELLRKQTATKAASMVIEIASQGKAYEIALPDALLRAGKLGFELVLVTAAGTVTLPADALTAYSFAADEQVELLLSRAQTDLTLETTISLTSNGKRLAWSKAASPITLALPYELTSSQDARFLNVWQLDEQGNRTLIPRSSYNAESKQIIFQARQMASFIVEYRAASFSDISQLAWARQEIELLAAKGIIQGISQTSFQPHAPITRADYIVLLTRMLQLQQAGNTDNRASFNDVSSEAYYYEAVSLAQALGIVQGDGASFRPSASISRQDMMVMTLRALQLLDLLDTGADEHDRQLERFTDHKLVAAYAQTAAAKLIEAGIIQGSTGGKLEPQRAMTRAEAAVLLHRIYELIYSTAKKN